MPSFYRCGVAGCTNNSETDPGANFYRLPDGELRSSWTEFLVSRGGTASNRIRVCSSHFTKDQFHNFTQVKLGFGKKRKLVDGAVPSLPPVPPSAARRSQQNVISMAEECHREEEQSSGAEMERSGEGSLRSVADLPAESSSSSERPQRGAVEDELDGFPVFGADEEDWESSSSQRGRHSEEQDESESQSRKVSQQSGANADDSAQQSQMEEGTSQNETSTSSQEQGGSFREETLYSPLMKIKDEPIDEGYDKALIPPSDISRVKEELENGEHEIATPPDELRISSVFSVRGAGDPISGSVAASQPPAFSTMSQSTSAIKAPLMVLPAQPQPQLQAKPLAQIQLQLQPQLQLQTQPQPQLQLQPQPQLQLQPQLQPQPPPASIRICCSGCSKVLQKGQTAFQRKGSNQLFCSTVCLTGFTLPPTISIAPKKTCHLCLKVIGNPKDLITVPVDSSNTLKEFCSQACLTIYRSRVEGFSEDSIVRCTMCRNPSEIQHEVNHQGVLHRLCSDECFSRFRSSKRLSMSCCESCGNCTVTGNYHLVQIEDAVKKFCSPVCISTYKQKSGKRVHCPYCHEFKSVDQMLEGTNAQGVIEFFCSSRCVTNSQASRTLSGASFPCTNCQKLAIPQYHLAMPDGSIRNFCSYECACRFQEKLQRAPTQMNGGSAVAPNTILNMAPRGPQYVSSRPPAPLNTPNLSASYMTASSQNPPSFVPTSNQNPIPPYVPAPGLANPQDSQNQQPDAPASAQSTIRLTCKQCQKQFRSKPEVLQFKNHVGLFCSRLCCDAYKREKDVRAVCEYCKEEKVLKDITMYEHKPRAFCCEGCKLLFKHDLAKQHGSQCRVCAYCCNMTHSTIQNHFGGKLEEFCTEECMSLYTVLFYEMAKCYWCKTQGTLSESLKWDGTIKHFCNLRCVLQFCSKSVVPDQPNSNGITTSATAAQAPLSLSKDMPVIGGVVSLASALAGNTALTGALPTSNASSKIIGDASTQTDAAVNVSPHQRRMLKNKALMCKPIIEEQGVQCHLEPPKPLFDTVVDENGEKVKLVPVPVPIPMPVYIPVPMHLYTQFTPVPLGLPLPVPVPLVMPASPESTQHTVTKASVPSQSSVEDEEAEKSKDRPVSHGDQGSTYSGDLESEARSTPFSWADTEDSSQLHKPSVPSFQIERPANTPTASTSPSPLDLEKDFPVASNDCGSSKEQKSPKRRKRGKRGRRRLGTDAANGSPPSSKIHHVYGVKAWASWVQWRTQQTEASALTVKEDVLQCSSAELSDGLCHFISEVRRPNGQAYAPDSVYYLCLGIQQYLLENGRLENVFMDPPYSQFTTDLTRLLKDGEHTLPPSGFLQSRVEESFLWDCKQLGALSPFALLNSLLFFGVKLLNLKTVDQHERLSFANIARCSRTTKQGTSSYLRIRLAGIDDDPEKQGPVLPGKRKREEDEENEEYMEMPENTENPLHCPVRLYEFYLSKCSDSVKQRSDIFYLQPESSCHPSSPMWYSSQPLERPIMESMLTRILAVRDVHLDPKQLLDSSDEESS
ncbi:zinc finger MYM-type protein 4 isoform X3 [Pygocentrus nattereri]|uniref:THAP-type domain-containing protein n=1 Tax=Pygocentrus nattereri TaxID=42514 RepID=A0A3B4CCG3_PYGNA|nr:zinc finger MYM-type protein 4 isoform X3 [Pygocentrus nattereri]